MIGDEDKLKPAERRKALDFAAAIAELAAEAPDDVTKRDLYRVANSVRRRFGFSNTERVAMVLQAVRIGASTIADVGRETGLPSKVVQWALNILEARRAVRFKNMSATGRPGKLISLVDLEDEEWRRLCT